MPFVSTLLQLKGHETGSTCDKRNAPTAARPVPEEALVALAGESASVAGGGSAPLRLSRLMAKVARQARSSSALTATPPPHLQLQEAGGRPLGPDGDGDPVLGGSGKKQASVAAAALLAVAS